MKKTIALIMILPLSFLHAGTPDVSAGHSKKHITPYGAFCSRTSHYGMHHGILDNKQVKKSLKHYYRDKGLNIEIVNSKGRFIKALVKDSDSVVDTVIFDRNSGRIRSIY